MMSPGRHDFQPATGRLGDFDPSRSELGRVWNSLIPTLISQMDHRARPITQPLLLQVFSRAYVSRLFLAYSIAAKNRTNSSCRVRSTPFHCDGH